jgi:hypothetical protein
MNRMLKGWRQTGRAEQFRAQWTRGVLERLELTLDEKNEVRHFLRRRHKVSTQGMPPRPAKRCWFVSLR